MPTILHRLARWADSDPHSVAQRYKRNGVWESITAAEYCDRMYYLALFFESRGMTQQDIGTVLAPNSYHWVHCDLAYLLLGAKSAGLYPNSTSKDIAYILNHTESRFLAVKDKEFFQKVQDAPDAAKILERLECIVVFDGDTSISPKAVAYEAAIVEGQRIASERASKGVQDYLRKIDPRAGAFMIYTSGTTGNPKGAILSHDNLTYTIDMGVKHWNLPFGKGKLFSFLPLCHIAEKLQCVGAGISQRYSVSFATKFENVSVELPEVQPTLLLCVPRLWEKMMEGVQAKIEAAPTPRKKLAKWAFGVGSRVHSARLNGRSPSPFDLLQLPIADKLVLSKIRKALGLDKADVLVSGAAALSAHVIRWFHSLGFEILEDFGQTESTGVICMTQPGRDCAGTVGQAVQGIDMKIAEDGELLTRGRNVFIGYFKDEKATQSTVVDGWLHTGDLAEITPEGMVRIRGRKKEIMKTSGGKMIAPVPIEERLKVAPMISQVCLVGDGRKFISALITLSEGTIKDARESGVIAKDARVVSDAVLHGQVKRHVDELNSELAGYEKIKKFVVLANEFSIADGEMTPTLKMKRAVIESRFKDLIDQMYADGE